MLVHVLRKMVGRCVAMEVGHPLRPTPIVFGGYLVGLYCSDTLAAVAVYTDRSENPPGYKPERATPEAPPPDPAKGLASGTSAPSNTSAGASNTGVMPGQPLPPMAGTASPSAPPPPAPTQSNVRPVVKDLIRDFNIKWVEVKNIISVETDGAVKVNFMRSKIIDVTRLEQMFDNAPEEVRDNNNTIHVIDADVRKAYHEQTAALLKKKVDALELPDALAGAPSAEEMLAVMNGVQADVRLYANRQGDLRLAVEQIIRMVGELQAAHQPPINPDRSRGHEGVVVPSPPASAYEVNPEEAKINT